MCGLHVAQVLPVNPATQMQFDVLSLVVQVAPLRQGFAAHASIPV